MLSNVKMENIMINYLDVSNAQINVKNAKIQILVLNVSIVIFSQEDLFVKIVVATDIREQGSYVMMGILQMEMDVIAIA